MRLLLVTFWLLVVLLGCYSRTNPTAQVTTDNQKAGLEQDSALLFDAYLGNYQVSDNHWLTVSRSLTRLYVYDNSSQTYRGLKKINDSVFTTGKTLISDDIDQTYRFYTDYVTIEHSEKPPTQAIKKKLYSTSNVHFTNHSDKKLGGTLFLPQKSNGIALVWIHGSGGQDRNGYAGIIRLFADVLTRQGYTILTYDKQGVGVSEGNWASLSFKYLAQDALAGIEFLKKRADLKLKKIGLAGSSQAGWVIAKAIEQAKKNVDFALLIGAAGSGISVIEQNLYNTKVQMGCTGQFSDVQIENALLQQRLFFEYIQNKQNPQTLDSLTLLLNRDSTLRDWLFPSSRGINFDNRNQWYTALELDFDPLSIWGIFDRPAFMLFSAFDDSTPTDIVVSKIKTLNNAQIKTAIIPNAQHIGLETDALCKNDIAGLQRFHPQFFKEITNLLSVLVK
jgi:pimeloyl-ACP methyl ester carboxylesterase